MKTQWFRYVKVLILSLMTLLFTGCAYSIGFFIVI